MSDDKNKDDIIKVVTESLDLSNPVIAHGVLVAKLLDLKDDEMLNFFLKVHTAMRMLADEELTAEKALMDIAEYQADLSNMEGLEGACAKPLPIHKAYQILTELYSVPIKKMIDL